MNYPAIRQCPVCGKYRFEVEFEECPICSWMNDVTQEENPDAKGLANIFMSSSARSLPAQWAAAFWWRMSAMRIPAASATSSMACWRHCRSSSLWCSPSGCAATTSPPFPMCSRTSRTEISSSVSSPVL